MWGWVSCRSSTLYGLTALRAPLRRRVQSTDVRGTLGFGGYSVRRVFLSERTTTGAPSSQPFGAACWQALVWASVRRPLQICIHGRLVSGPQQTAGRWSGCFPCTMHRAPCMPHAPCILYHMPWVHFAQALSHSKGCHVLPARVLQAVLVEVAKLRPVVTLPPACACAVLLSLLHACTVRAPPPPAWGSLDPVSAPSTTSPRGSPRASAPDEVAGASGTKSAAQRVGAGPESTAQQQQQQQQQEQQQQETRGQQAQQQGIQKQGGQGNRKQQQQHEQEHALLALGAWLVRSGVLPVLCSGPAMALFPLLHPEAEQQLHLVRAGAEG